MPPCTVRFIYIPKKLGLCRLSQCSLMMCAYNRVHYGPMVVFLCLNIKLPHYHHYADISEGIELLKCLSVNSVTRVCLRFSQFSQLSFMQYMGLCLLSLPISLMIVRIRMLYLIIIKSEVCPIRHCLGLDHETMVLAIETPQSYTCLAFQEMLNFGKSWICHRISFEIVCEMSLRGLNKRVWEHWLLTASCFEQIHDSYDMQYQKMVFHAGSECTWATLLLWWLRLKWNQLNTKFKTFVLSACC